MDEIKTPDNAVNFMMASLLKNVRPDDEVEAAEELQREKARADHLDDVLKCGIGSKFNDADFSNYEAKEYETIKTVRELIKYAENPGRKTAFLLGNVGLGKTHLGVAILKTCRRSPAYVSMREACIELAVSRSFKADKNTKEVLDGYSRSGMLVIDEIGRGSDTSDEKLFLSYVMNKRYENNRPTVLITNLAYDAVKTLLGADIIDRILETGKSFTLTGESYRATHKDV